MANVPIGAATQRWYRAETMVRGLERGLGLGVRLSAMGALFALSSGCSGQSASAPAAQAPEAPATGTTVTTAATESPSVPPVPETPRAPETLRAAAAQSGRKVGVALATWFFNEPQYQELAAQHFDSLTAENEMKWEHVQPEPGKFTFEGGDKLVAFAEQSGMRVRGHTLVWHNQLPAWVKARTGAELKKVMLDHVRTTATHWRGKIAQWDVVNEAVDETGALRKNSPFSALGREYVAEAFRAAHEADPNARLYYNDYDIEAPSDPKTEGAYQLVKWLKESGVPIHGMGFQVHVDPRKWPSGAEMQRTFERFAALGLEIEITELDIPVGEIPGTLEQKLAEQRRITREMVGACVAVRACTGVTVWGLTDKHSWLSTPEWAPRRGKGPHLALLFDDRYQPKPAFTGALEAFLQR